MLNGKTISFAGRTACLAIATLLLLLHAQGGPASAQQLLRIVAVVNDQIISAHDMEQRLDLVIRSANMPDNQETREQLAPQILRTLIDEQLQLQEARRRGIQVSEEELQSALQLVERNNNMQPGDLAIYMEQRRIPKAAIMEQLTAEIAWTELLTREIVPRIQITEQQVQSEIQRWQQLQGETEYHIAEIQLFPDTPAESRRAGELAARLVQDMREGARFSFTAQQFSQGPTAAAGGDIGWVDGASLIREVREIVERMPVGAVTDPIEIPGGWTIIFLRDRRTIGVSGVENSTFVLSQLAYAAPPEWPAARRDEVRRRADQARTQLGSCDDIDRVGEASGAVEGGLLGNVRLSDLPLEFFDALKDLGPGDVTEAVDNERAFILLMVCDRLDQEDVRLDPEMVRQRLAGERIGLQARRYLRDLRRDALIEIRN